MIYHIIIYAVDVLLLCSYTRILCAGWAGDSGISYPCGCARRAGLSVRVILVNGFPIRRRKKCHLIRSRLGPNPPTVAVHLGHNNITHTRTCSIIIILYLYLYFIIRTHTRVYNNTRNRVLLHIYTHTYTRAYTIRQHGQRPYTTLQGAKSKKFRTVKK